MNDRIDGQGRSSSWRERVGARYRYDREHKRSHLLLGIESSCDETSAAVVENGRTIRSNIVSSQIDIHRQFGGVVPEVASRRHLERITYVVEEALCNAGITAADLSGIAVTYGPGLVGALLIGVTAAKALSHAWSLPLLGVHHVAGHIAADALSDRPLAFPLIALVVSGGHTDLIVVREPGRFERIGSTRDDAVGEAYDKVARALGLPYPGGPEVDRLAADGNATSFDLPRAWLEAESFDFSFSGLKSAVQNMIHNAAQRGHSVEPADMAAAFQSSVIDVLVGKTIRAVTATGIRRVLVVGGVAANKGLRARFEEAARLQEFTVRFPPLSLCGDNAAMIAAAAFLRYEQGLFDALELNAIAGLSLTEWQSGSALWTADSHGELR